jgi:quercetin dioxygenase-like cupin family protein
MAFNSMAFDSMAFNMWHSRGEETPIRVPAIGLELTVRLPSRETGRALTIIDTTNAPGFGPPLHRHPETEIFRVLRGRYLFEVDGRRFVAAAGDVVSVPGGAAHAFVNVTTEPAQQTITILPAFDAAAFFTALGALMQDGVPAQDALNAFGRSWNVEFLGPPLVP